MRDAAFAFLLSAVLCAAIGMAWGIWMGLSGDHAMAPAHAHLNLVGWATLGLLGAYYRLTPQAGAARLARVHALIAIPGTAVMVAGMAILLSGGTEAVAILGSLLVAASMLLFLATVLRHGFGPAQAAAAPASSARPSRPPPCGPAPGSPTPARPSRAGAPMRMTRYFLPLLRENPAEAQVASHRLMLRAGMIKQQAAGIYSWLPLGYRVLRNVERIVHEEQARAGHLPLLMPTLQPADLWQESGRYNAYGPEMLRIRDRNDRDMLYGPTNEEMITDVFRSGVSSYKDLPLTLYHVQWKFRDELRPRFGVMRGREFLMKDGYTFDVDVSSGLHAYNRHMVAYLRTYERMGLTAIPMRADSGPIGGDDTHEFLVLAATGESTVFYDDAVTRLKLGDREVDYEDRAAVKAVCDEFTSLYARTDETHDQADFEEAVPEARRREGRGIEVGQIFFFGTKYSEPMKAFVTDASGARVPVQMGSHGIGVSRLLGAIIEASHDDRGIIWPEGVTPFHAGLVNLRQGDAATDAACEGLYKALRARGLDPLYDDRDARAGEKFAAMDLIGLPWRITVGPRGLANGVVELTSRRTGESEEMSPEAVVDRVAGVYAGV